MSTTQSSSHQIIESLSKPLYQFAICLTGEEESAKTLIEEAFQRRLQMGLDETEPKQLIKQLFKDIYRLFNAEFNFPANPPPISIGQISSLSDLNEETLFNLFPIVDTLEELNKLSEQDIISTFLDVHPVYRPALTLYYLGEFSIKDIAYILDTEIDIIKELIFKGKYTFYHSVYGKIQAKRRKILLLTDNEIQPRQS